MKNQKYDLSQAINLQNPNIKVSPSDVEITSTKDFHNSNIYENIRKKECLYIKIFLAIIYFVLCISMEQVYRESLFDESIDIQEDIRDDYDKESAFYDCWKFFTNFGEAKITFLIFAIIFLFFPISSSFLTLQVLIYTIYVTNFLKIIYRNGRPYWKSDKLDIVCNAGYGNPSGHTMTSTAYYLSLSHIVTNFEFFRKSLCGRILRVIIFCLLCILGALVIISRVLLSAHGINQVLFAFTLGLFIYFVCIYILSYHTYEPNDFIIYITSCLVVTIYMIFHIALLIALIIVYFSLDENEKIEYNVYNNIFNGVKCKIKKKYLMLKHDGFFQALAITALLGAHLGILVLVCLLKKNNYVINGYITDFNQSSIKRWLIRLPILIVSGIFILLYYLVSGNSALSVVFIFKSAVSFFLTTLGIYFIGIFISITCNLANENITKINLMKK